MSAIDPTLSGYATTSQITPAAIQRFRFQKGRPNKAVARLRDHRKCTDYASTNGAITKRDEEFAVGMVKEVQIVAARTRAGEPKQTPRGQINGGEKRREGR